LPDTDFIRESRLQSPRVKRPCRQALSPVIGKGGEVSLYRLIDLLQARLDKLVVTRLLYLAVTGQQAVGLPAEQRQWQHDQRDEQQQVGMTFLHAVRLPRFRWRINR
jgi:hypothetical protein